MVHTSVVLKLPANAHRVTQRDEYRVADFPNDVRVDWVGGHRQFGVAYLARHRVDCVDDLLDRLVARVERAKNVLFDDLFRASLDHHDRLAAPCDNQIKAASLPLLVRGVDEQIIADQPDADRCDGPLRRQSRERERGGSASQR